MILRRVADLTTVDNVRLDDRLLWNVEAVTPSDRYVEVRLSRTKGEKLTLMLRPDDLILLAI
jgi:hypothetical protein